MLSRMLRQILSVSLFCAFVTAQDEGIIDTLTGVLELSRLVTYLEKYPDFTNWLQGLSDVTFLAPSNAAFGELAGALPVDQTSAEALLSYHVLDGAFYDFSYDVYLHIPTAALPYASGNETMVSGGDVVVARGSSWSSAVTFTSGELHTSEATGEAFYFDGGIIYIIDSFLTLPQTFEATVTVEEQDMLAGQPFADAIFTKPGTQNNVTIDDLSDVTVFLPMNYSLQEIGNVIEAMSVSDFDRLVSYHVVDGILDINADAPPSGYYNTYEGTGVTIYSSNGVVFVNNAQIVGTPDWIFRGGMIYTIYGVLNPQNVTIDANANGAQVAFAGAKYTPDFTFPTSDTGSTPSGSSGGSSGSHSGISTAVKAGIGAACAATLVILIGVFMFWRQRRQAKKELGGDTKYQYPISYPMKDLEASISHEELVANAAKPARGPIKEFTPNVSVHSLGPEIKETSI